MAEAEKSKDKERSRSPLEEESHSEEDSDSSMTTSDAELDPDVDLEAMDDEDTSKKAEGKDSEKRTRAVHKGARSSRGAGRERSQNQDLSRERQQRLLNLLLPPWMRLGASRWATGGIASHTSRSSGAVKRKREEGGSDEEEVGEKSEPVFERKFFWTCNKETGFPHRVNHAVAGHRDADGDWYAYSFGGYHADDDERTVLEADNSGGPFFKSTPIDVHRFEMDTQTCVQLVPPLDEVYFNVEPHCRTTIPGSRYGHTVCSYRDRIYMYGGRNDEDGSFSKVDCYDIRNNIWIKVKALGDIPSSRDGHACTRLGEEMIIHGGFSADDIKFSSDILAFNMETFIWRKLPSSGFRVPERDFHTATSVNRKLLVFGGRSDMFAPYFTANDVYDEVFYVYDYDTTEWKRQDVTGYGVKGRRSHCAACIGSSVIYFGGYNATTKEHFGDVFIVNTDTWVITEIRPFGDAPCPRRRVGCALVGSDLFVCGGTSPIEVTRGGRQKEILHDHNDVYILHLVPTLEQMCTMVLIREKMDLRSLPVHLQKKIETIHNMKIDPIKKLPIFENLG